ncbi:MAG: metal ABC transporter substrate-binding protein [Hyphomicrobiales bacterium]|jgi:zinc/manganese transport system substrate-binding protein|nr:zinc ABC transporter substrate-binding protein [Methylobacterium sp.]MCA3651481.1 zinc ABC transporter substrate-binding protein [Methylobacterium sp.]MCA4924103.1 zinc ABC transporter substrate-binding protein [Methylobacterium sp.]MCE2933781.1 metal ABC transporter substrate-binding protein [Hyphomicrobiales bacterium]
MFRTDDLKQNNIHLSRRLALGLILAAAMMPGLALAQAKEPVQVVASFSILADLAKQVGGDRVRVVSLVGPNADTHVFRATPQDAKIVKEADLLIVNGLGFDGFMPRLVKSSGSKARIVTASNGLNPLEKPKSGGHDHGHGHAHDHGKHDPHAWQSIDAVKIYVSNIRDGLIAADKEGEAVFRANAEKYLAELDRAKTEIAALLASIPRDNRLGIVNHDSFRYFTRDFGIRIEGARGLSTETEPSAQDIARIVRAARERKAKAVFLENVADPRIAEKLAKETGARLGGTLYSDALTDEKGPAPTYLALMRHNAKTIAEALKD